jgi:hypothetical protein
MQAEGYVFLEIYVEDLQHYVSIFRDALGFRVVENDDDFVKLASTHGTVLLNSMTDLPATHPFASFRTEPRRGMGVEMGIVTKNLDKAWRAAREIPGCVVSEVTHQEWGMSDFRILSREGYYFRVTTPDEEGESGE